MNIEGISLSLVLQIYTWNDKLFLNSARDQNGKHKWETTEISHTWKKASHNPKQQWISHSEFHGGMNDKLPSSPFVVIPFSRPGASIMFWILTGRRQEGKEVKFELGYDWASRLWLGEQIGRCHSGASFLTWNMRVRRMVMLEDFMKTQRVTKDRRISHSSHSVNIGYTCFFFPWEEQ